MENSWFFVVPVFKHIGVHPIDADGMADSVGHDKTASSGESYLGLHCMLEISVVPVLRISYGTCYHIYPK